MTTLDENKLAILADLWMNYRNDEDFADFIEYNDLGLPIAYAMNEGLVKGTDLSLGFVNETFELLLTGLDIEDTGFEDLNEILDSALDAKE